MIRKKNLISAFFLLAGLWPCLALAQAPPGGFSSSEIYTRITTSRIQRYKIVVATMPVEGITLADSNGAAMRLRNVIADDLDFSLRFDALNSHLDDYSLVSLSSAKDKVDFVGWKKTGADYLVAGSFFEIEQNPMVEIRVYDLSLEDLVFLKNYTVEFPALRRIAHRIADDVVLNVTGERGIASTRIALIAPVAKDTYEVFCCDYDGYNLIQVTKDNSLAMIPIWTSNGEKISYTTFKGGDADLYTVDLKTGKSSPLIASKGVVDMAATWCERNGFMAFSSGISGGQEIYYLRPGDSKPIRLTFAHSMDIEPSWSPTGMEIAFSSTRAGNPHIFIMDADGLNLRRLTFESRNFTPRWRPLPYGDKIILTSEIRGIFQIAIIDVSGDNFIQLTTDGENRDASWSPDGLHIVFTSDRRGGRENFEIFTMDWNGNTQRPLYSSFRTGREPAWSPYLER